MRKDRYNAWSWSWSCLGSARMCYLAEEWRSFWLLLLGHPPPSGVHQSGALYVSGTPETEFLDLIQTKVLRVFHLAIHSQSSLHSTALPYRFLFLQTHATSYNFYSSVIVHYKGEGGKPDRKPYPLPYDLRNPDRNLKCENSQAYAQKPQRNCKFMNSASGYKKIHCVHFTNSPLCSKKHCHDFPWGIMPN